MTSGLKEEHHPWEAIDTGDRSSSVWEIEVPVAPGAVAFALHDAKNMVGVVSATVDYLNVELSTASIPFGIASALEDLRASASRLSDLLREALVGLRGATEPTRTASHVRVLPLVTAAASRFRRRAEAAGVRVDLRAKEDPDALVAADLLERILDNLLDNALRFSKAGDVIEITCTMCDGRALVLVDDEGPGVPEEARDAVFSAYRACGAPSAAERPQTRPSAGHFGLGLAFCRAVTRAYGGDVRVETSPRGGARFVVDVG